VKAVFFLFSIPLVISGCSPEAVDDQNYKVELEENSTQPDGPGDSNRELDVAGDASSSATDQSIGDSDNAFVKKADTAFSGMVKRSSETGRYETYPEYRSRRDSYNGTRGTSHSFGCTVDCGGHEAGYALAEEENVTSIDECKGNGWSFVEGCMAYVIQQNGNE
jgi:hypothetical protein